MKYICASHGNMASGVKNTIEMFLGKQENVYAIDAYVGKCDFMQEFLSLVESFGGKEEIIVFTDVFSGSVNQMISNCLNTYDIKVLAGFNLPLIMEIMLRGETLSDEEISQAVEQAREQMVFMNSLISRESLPEESKNR